ncbi:hypothetical protein [Nocardia vinacea]|uniref:hypothetical protein n=1 Tax=Nocardia vinacea TaxID=96468 RepID=UPI0012F66839|nr:hypothetical protein [Nocardia vinacea]
MRTTDLRKRCERRIDTLWLPARFGIDEVCERLASHVGSRIELIPMALPPASPLGLLLTDERGHSVIYEESASLIHRQQIIFHEFAHLLFGHTGQPIGDDRRHCMFVHIAHEIQGQVLARSCGSTEQETEAEMTATLLLQRAHRSSQPVTVAADPAIADIVRRLDNSL